MQYNVSNMPLNTFFRFDTNRYVFSTMLFETRNGNYKLDKPTKFTEVYEIGMDGSMKLVASGRLIENPSVYDYTTNFAIMDYDQDDTIQFHISMYLQEVSKEELKEIREAVANNKRNHK